MPVPQLTELLKPSTQHLIQINVFVGRQQNAAETRPGIRQSRPALLKSFHIRQAAVHLPSDRLTVQHPEIKGAHTASRIERWIVQDLLRKVLRSLRNEIAIHH